MRVMCRVDLIRSVGKDNKTKVNEDLSSLGTALSHKVIKTVDCISTKGTRALRLDVTSSLESFPPTPCHGTVVIID
jgi:hypothetical protein